jgi:hypothetical protein
MQKPLIPASLNALALAIGAALFAASAYVPSPYSLVAAGLGSVALFLAGLGWRLPEWAAGKPLLPATLVPLALGLKTVLEQVAPLLAGNAQVLASAGVGLLSLLAGALLPEPVKAVVPTEGTPAAKNGPVAQVATTCSLADRARGLC